jgi:hypothetical protein
MTKKSLRVALWSHCDTKSHACRVKQDSTAPEPQGQGLLLARHH